MLIDLRQDLHTHSTFSDGANSLLENIRAAEKRGIETLATTDHVRRQTDWLPDYVRTLDSLRAQTSIKLLCGVEAKLLNVRGDLDLPSDLHGIELIQIADHSFPLGEHFYTPSAIRTMHQDGILSRREIVSSLIDATVRAMERYSATGPQLVLAHLFSILPKINFNEIVDIRDEDIARIAYTARQTNTFIEVSERWRCPHLHTVKMLARLGVTIVASSDAHRAEHIGAFDQYVKPMSAILEASHLREIEPEDHIEPNFVLLDSM